MSGTQSALVGAGGGGVKPSGLICSTMTPSDGIQSNVLFYTGQVPRVPSGVCVANTLKTVLSLTGKGALSFLACGNNDSTSRNHRMKVTLDGIVIFDSSANSATTTQFFCVVGSLSVTAAATGVITYEPLCFDNSLLIEYASSLSETNLTNICYRYMPRA